MNKDEKLREGIRLKENLIIKENNLSIRSNYLFLLAIAGFLITLVQYEEEIKKFIPNLNTSSNIISSLIFLGLFFLISLTNNSFTLRNEYRNLIIALENEDFYLLKIKPTRILSILHSIILGFILFIILRLNGFNYSISLLMAIIFITLQIFINLKKETINMLKVTNFIGWLKKSKYHTNFFIGVWAGIATFIALQTKGLSIFSSFDAFLSWAIYVFLFLLMYILGAIMLYLID